MHISYHYLSYHTTSRIFVYFLYRTQMISEAFITVYKNNFFASLFYNIAQYLPYRIEWGNGAINIKTIQINLNTIYDHRIKS